MLGLEEREDKFEVDPDWVMPQVVRSCASWRPS